jgi:hypothetical protein
MSNQTVTADEIIVHGRGSLSIPYKVMSGSVQVDLSTYSLFFEVNGAAIRVALEVDPNDALGKVIVLHRTDVEKLKTVPLSFAVVDETGIVGGLPRVLWDGKISRDGYIHSPVP